ARPDATYPWTEVSTERYDWLDLPLEVPGLGLAYSVIPRIASVRDGSPAAKARLKPGDAIRAMTVTPARPREGEPGTPTFTFDQKHPDWPFAFAVVQEKPRYPVLFTLAGSESPVAVTPEPVPDWFNPSRGLPFLSVIRPLPPQDLLSATRRGFWDTLDRI